MDLRNIAPEFTFLEQLGMYPGSSTYLPSEFGNASLDMQTDNFTMRFIRDRGQVLVSAMDKTGRTFQLGHILEFLDMTITQGVLGSPPDLSIMADALRKHWSEVARIFANQQDLLRLQLFEDQKSGELLQTIAGLM